PPRSRGVRGRGGRGRGAPRDAERDPRRYRVPPLAGVRRERGGPRGGGAVRGEPRLPQRPRDEPAAEEGVPGAEAGDGPTASGVGRPRTSRRTRPPRRGARRTSG